MRYLGIDWGTKRIGLAVGDDELKIASPLCVVESIDFLAKIINDEDIEAIVLGAPDTMAGTQGKNNVVVDEFKKKLEEKFQLPVFLVDERLSSKGADALVGDKKTKAARDSLAAMIVLQNYLDRME